MKIMEKGQATMEALLGVPITLIGLVVMFALLDPIGEVLFDVLNSANSSVITNVSTIKLLVGFIGLIVAVMALISIINSFRARPPQQLGYV